LQSVEKKVNPGRTIRQGHHGEMQIRAESQQDSIDGGEPLELSGPFNLIRYGQNIL
jgi:hypothetical protein